MPQEKPLAKLRLFVYKVTMGTAGAGERWRQVLVQKKIRCMTQEDCLYLILS